jgi:hypothetical protein
MITRARQGLVAGALALLAGWIALRLRTTDGPSLIWTAAHLVLLTGYIVLLLAGFGAFRWLQAKKEPSWLPKAGIILMALGTLAFVGQMTVDLLAGMLSADQAGMDKFFDLVQGPLAAKLALYAVGPALFYTGLLVLVGLLVRAQVFARTGAVLAVTGIALIAFVFTVLTSGTSSLLYPLGLTCLSIGFALPRVSSR